MSIFSSIFSQFKTQYLSFVQVTHNTVDVKWENPTDMGYTSNEITCIPNTPDANAVYTSVGPNTTEITIHDLESGTEYTMMLYTRIDDQLSRI